MRRRLPTPLLCFAALGLLVAILFGWGLWTARQTHCGGKPLAYWLRQLPSTDYNIRLIINVNGVESYEFFAPVTTNVASRYPLQKENPKTAIAAIRSIGRNGLPFILRQFVQERSPIERALQKSASKCGIKRSLFPDPSISRSQATTALLALVPLPPDALTRLQTLSTNKSQSDPWSVTGAAASFVLEMNADTNSPNWQKIWARYY